MKQTRLKNGVTLVRLDKRSGETFNHFKYRVDLHSVKEANEFIDWAQDHLGKFVPWNLYYVGRNSASFETPNWTVRYQETGSAFTEVFVRVDLVPAVVLHWQQT